MLICFVKWHVNKFKSVRSYFYFNIAKRFPILNNFYQPANGFYLEPSCEVNGKRYHIGDSIRSAFFLMKCSEDGYKIVGKQYLHYLLYFYIPKTKLHPI